MWYAITSEAQHRPADDHVERQTSIDLACVNQHGVDYEHVASMQSLRRWRDIAGPGGVTTPAQGEGGSQKEHRERCISAPRAEQTRLMVDTGMLAVLER